MVCCCCIFIKLLELKYLLMYVLYSMYYLKLQWMLCKHKMVVFSAKFLKTSPSLYLCTFNSLLIILILYCSVVHVGVHPFDPC